MTLEQRIEVALRLGEAPEVRETAPLCYAIYLAGVHVANASRRRGRPDFMYLLFDSAARRPSGFMSWEYQLAHALAYLVDPMRDARTGVNVERIRWQLLLDRKREYCFNCARHLDPSTQECPKGCGASADHDEKVSDADAEVE